MKSTSLDQLNSSTGGSYLSFKLGDEFYAITVKNIFEILEVPSITKLPNSPTFIKGVVDLRGTALPAIDTRVKFGMDPGEFTINTCIIVVNVLMGQTSLTLGILVDEVLEVFDAEPGNIQQAPVVGEHYRSEFIDGMIKEGDKFMMLLDPNKIFSEKEIKLLKSTSTVETNEEISA
jgi:purine-binding chemotaxis protein CheW